jgi:sulfite reductase alpha subunit-like flavoprotein
MQASTSALRQLAIFAASTAGILVLSWAIRKFNGGLLISSESLSNDSGKLPLKKNRKVQILYGTVTGTAREMAFALFEDLKHGGMPSVRISNLKDYNEDNLESEDVVILICSTWSEGAPPEDAAQFFAWLNDAAHDFRVSKSTLSKMTFAAFGLGGAVYSEHFCKPVRRMTCLPDSPLLNSTL